MKKLLSLMFGLLIGLGLTSCSSCGKHAPEPEPAPQYDDTLVVEELINADFDDISAQYADSLFRWYETDMLLESYLDEAEDNTVSGVTNVFQTVTELPQGGYDTHVILYSHVVGTTTVEEQHGFWTENIVLTPDAVTLTFDEAFDRVMQSNFVKPHSRYCTLRIPLGPVRCNAQYVFGNVKSQLYVDALTGEVANENPAFKGFSMPLGEWP